MNIRIAKPQTDYDEVWNIFEKVISTGDTYVFDPNTAKESLQKNWLADYMDTFVAVDANEKILGTYIIKPNQIDLGNHIANCRNFKEFDKLSQKLSDLIFTKIHSF